MKVLLIHEHGRAHGSGGVVATYRLHQGLLRDGVQSTLACRNPASDSTNIVELPRSDFLEKWLGKITWRLGLNDIHCISSLKIPKFEPFEQADVVNIHGLHTNYLNYLALPLFAKQKPVVLTLHDMWAFTGHCGYNLDCERWRIGCGNCPYPESYPPVGRDATAIEWKLKQWVYERSNLTIVTPSKWMAGLAKQSMLDRFDIHQISNAVDTEIYKPIDKRKCRKELGINPDKLVVGFAAFSLASKIKGGDLLVEALAGLSDQLRSKLVLLTFGGSSEQFVSSTGIETAQLGYLTDDQSKVKAYNAADIFVVPSRHENQGLVPIESIACSTPVVSFSVGGLPEVVREGLTGCLATPGNAVGLREKITLLLTNKAMRQKLSESCRRIAVNEFDMNLHVKRYGDLYASLAGQAMSVSQPQSTRHAA